MSYGKRKTVAEKQKEASVKADINYRQLISSPYYTGNLQNFISQTNNSLGYDGKRKYLPKSEPPMEMDRGRRIRHTTRQDTTNVENTDTARVDTTRVDTTRVIPSDTITVKQDTVNVNNDTIPAKANTIPPVEGSTTDLTVPHHNTAYDLERIINSPYAFENITDNSQAYVNVPEENRKPRFSIKNNNSNIQFRLISPNHYGSYMEDSADIGQFIKSLYNDFDYGFNNYIKPIFDKIDLEGQITKGYLDFLKKREFRNKTSTNLILDESKRPNKLEESDNEYWGKAAESKRIRDEINQMFMPITNTGMRAYGSSSNIATGIIPQDMGLFATANRLQSLPEGYNISSPWANWVDLNENTKDSKTSRNSKDTDFDWSHFYQGKDRRPSLWGAGRPSYLVVNNEGKFYTSDTIPTSDRGKITTGFYGTGMGLLHNPDGSLNIDGERLHIADSTGVSESGNYLFSDMKNPKTVNDRNFPINSVVVVNLPDGTKYPITFFGRTAAEFDREIQRLQKITGDKQMQFHSFDSRSAKYPFFSNETRLSAFHKPGFPALVLKKRIGGRKSLEY